MRAASGHAVQQLVDLSQLPLNVGLRNGPGRKMPAVQSGAGFAFGRPGARGVLPGLVPQGRLAEPLKALGREAFPL